MPANNPEKDLFNAALDQRPENREAFVRKACGNDPSLYRRVTELLKNHDDASRILADETNTIRMDLPIEEGPGTRIGRYKLLQQIGEGGMGVVYMAEQEEPVRRRVALKIIKLGMDSRSVVARFEAERQALALMDHPNIAKVFDGGVTDTGRPYFVMELVQGVPITEFCDKTKLSAKERLKLFVHVCQAVQHAHQKGIIHRDIKPSNILVTLHDGVPVPKVIDFGIAKATNQKLTEKTLFTNFATMIGTPAYMSPEQAEMSGLDVDTRTDIYALGVLLYALLTGTTPFTEKRLRSLGYGEMQRVILEEEPERPSSRLSTMANERKTLVAKNCGEELASLGKLLKGDLDWIVMKCLEKDRQRRYETANALANDVQRHLTNEPVIARPPGQIYRFRKAYRRNRVAFTAAACVLISMVVSMGFMKLAADREGKARVEESIQRNRAEQQREQAEASARAAEIARTAENQQRTLAEQRVYNSLVREARALRLARRVGYRDQVFSLLKQATAIKGAEKNVGEMRREAVACLGDFVGRTPVTFTNWPADSMIYQADFSPLGNMAVFRLGHRLENRDQIILRELPSGRELFRHTSDRSIERIRFLSTNRFLGISIPFGSYRVNRNTEATVSVWMQRSDGNWAEVTAEKLAGAYDCLVSRTRKLILVHDPSLSEVRLLDAESRVTLHRIQVSRSELPHPRAVLSADGHWLAIQTATSPGGPTPEVAIWNLEQGKEILRRPLKDFEVILELGSNGDHLITYNTIDRYLTVYETATLRQSNKIPDVVVDGEGGTSVIPDHPIVALPTYMTREMRLVDYLRQEVIATLDEPRNPHLAAFSPDGRYMLSVGVLHARLYDLSDEAVQRHLPGRPDATTCSVHPNQPRIAITGSDGVLSLRDTETGAVIWKRSGLENVAVGGEGESMLMALDIRTQRGYLLDWASGEHILTVGTNAPGFMHDFWLSPDGGYLLTSSSSAQGGGDATPLLSDDPTLGRVSIWKLKRAGDGSEKLTATWSHGLTGKYCSFCFLGASTKVAFMDYHLSPSVYVWDITTTNAPTKLPLKPRWSFGSLVATPDGSRLWMIDADGALICADANTGARLMTSREGLDRMDIFGAAGLSISPDGTKLAVLSTADRGLEIFDAKTGRLMYHLPSPASIAANFMWMPDSRRLIVNSWNADISIWNLEEVDRILAGLGLGMDTGSAVPSPGSL